MVSLIKEALSVDANPKKRYRVISTEVVFITPEIAFEWLAKYAFERQRRLSYRKIAAFARTILGNEAFPSSIYLARSNSMAPWTLVDAQHRLQAIVETQMGAEFVVIRVEVDTWDEVGRLYAKIDSAGHGRNFRDAIRSTGIAEDLEMTSTEVSQVGTACVLLGAGFRHTQDANSHFWLPEERLKSVEAWGEYAAKYFQAITGCSKAMRGKLGSQGVISVGLVALKYEESKAMAFFEAIAANSGLVRGTAEHTFVNQVMLTAVKPVGSGGMARLTAACWNAYYDGRTLAQAKVMDPHRPILIKGMGSPFNGKVHDGYKPGTDTLYSEEVGE